MSLKKTDKPEKTFKIIIICALIFTLGAGIWWFWFRNKPEQQIKDTPPVKAPETTVRTSDPSTSPEPGNLLRYDKDDVNFQELMNRRKSEYGLDKGVDMIVNENESLEIGGTTIPMHEILDKIRLKKGGIVEQDLGNRLQIQRKQESLEVLVKRLKESEARFWELERALSITKEGQGPDEFGGQIREHAELSKIMDDYQEYKHALKQIDEEREILDAENQREKVSEKVNTLEQRKDALEKELKKFVASRMPEDMGAEDISLLEELDKLDKRFIELEKDIGASEVNENDEEFQKKVRERASLRKIIAGYDVYRQITKEVEEKKTLLKKDEEQIKKSVQTRLDALRIKRDDIENSLKIRLMPDEGLAVYGIYVVRSGDNIWNIHFRFLKEYFKTRDINISSSADEPIRPGMSSGIGKILKFSENMVYIYNLREHQLSMNLNIIHPLSKIVVFNMGQAFELLNKIDYESIMHIHFDGENIWIPAEQ